MANQSFTAILWGLLADPLSGLSQRILARVPAFLAALLLLLAGLFIARVLRTLLERLFDRAKLDEYTGKIGINEILARLGLGKSPTYVLGFLTYWMILVVFFVSAANVIELPVVSELLERFMLFLPSVVAAVLILFGGLLFARFFSEVVANAATANDIRGGTLLAKAAYGIVLVFSALMALEQLGIQMLLISSSIQIILATVGLACALAFGLGGKDLAADFLRDLIKKKD